MYSHYLHPYLMCIMKEEGQYNKKATCNNPNNLYATALFNSAITAAPREVAAARQIIGLY